MLITIKAFAKLAFVEKFDDFGVDSIFEKSDILEGVGDFSKIESVSESANFSRNRNFARASITKLLQKPLIAFLAFWSFCLLAMPESLHKDPLDEVIIQEIFISKIKQPILKIVRIDHGWTNRNYKVTTQGKTYFTRIGTSHPESLGISREKELFFYKQASVLEIAPPLIYADPKRGILILPFVESVSFYGKVLGKWTEDRTIAIERITHTMKHFHSIKAPMDGSTGHHFSIIASYIAECKKAHASLPPDIERALHIVEKAKHLLPPKRRVLCHNDFFWENLLFDGKKLWLVDWEYADWEDPLYDLASFCIAHQLNDEERALALASYAPRSSKSLQQKLELMCMLYSLRNSLWGYLQIALCPNIPFNIEPIATMHYTNFWKFAEKTNLANS